MVDKGENSQCLARLERWFSKADCMNESILAHGKLFHNGTVGEGISYV
jgi:hypothetical protein